MPITHQKDLRKGRFSQASQIYHVTSATINRESVFQDFELARHLISALQEAHIQQQAYTLAFVIMPDHFHWLMQLGEKQSLSQVVRVVKAKATCKLGRQIWQKGFYDHALRQEESMQDIARYIVANPLRAGLVKSIGDYPHWDAIWL